MSKPVHSSPFSPRRLRAWGPLAAVLLAVLLLVRTAAGQPQLPPPRGMGLEPSPETQERIDRLIGEILEPDAFLTLDPRKSKLLRTRRPVTRFSITNPERVVINQYSPMEFELIGGQPGEATLTFWFGDEVLRYIVRVQFDSTLDELRAVQYGDLEGKINRLFPNSRVQLIPFSNKLIVRGQARDVEEASNILSMLSGESTDPSGQQLGPGSAPTIPASNIINLLDIPGEQQVMLKVRVAELSRAAVRQIGSDLAITRGEFTLTSLFGTGNPFNAILTTDEVNLALSAVASNSYSKILAEPNLVTLNGQPASFISGGEFAVPTVVGVGGVGAASTSFRGFGTQVFFVPTILDKDRIRLVVTPSFSTVNGGLAVDGIPGLNSRAVTTTVDLREGQWLAIAGLIQDEQSGEKGRVPLLGDIPILDTLFSSRSITRGETELLILVSPELVHPLEPKHVPMILPGFEVTEPGDWDFYMFGYYEGKPGKYHRSTVRPIFRQRLYEDKVAAMKEARRSIVYQASEHYYVQGSHGFSE